MLYLGKDILGKDNEKLATYLGDISEENIDEAKKWFQKAINKNDFQGWDYMASLSYALSLLDKENKDSKVQKAFREAVKKGADLGSPRAYSWLEHSFDSQDVKEIVQKHGQSPYKDLWKDLKSFIEAK